MKLCPYCRTEIPPDDARAVICEGCQTPHHAECWLENGGCTLFGCRLAPPDGPKVQVTNSEVVQAPGGPQAFGAAAAAPTGFGDAAAVQVVPRMTTNATPPPPRLAPANSPSANSASLAATAVRPAAIGYVAPGSIFAVVDPEVRAPKARIAFIMLGIFLGALGAHNFYAGYVKRGILQLCLSVATLGYGAVVSWIWAIVEVCTVDRDARDVSFA